MAKISEAAFLDKLLELARNAEGLRPEWDDIRAWVLGIAPDKEGAEGNKNVDSYIKIKLEGVRRNIREEKGLKVTPESCPVLFPRNAPAGTGGRGRVDKGELYDSFLNEMGIETDGE
jgi:hypothetical protein